MHSPWVRDQIIFIISIASILSLVEFRKEVGFRNLTLDLLLSFTHLDEGTCEHAGCKAKLNWGNVRTHDGVCVYKPVKCAWSNQCKILQV